MAINPAFTTQNARPLPILFGYGYGVGDPVIQYVDTQDTQYGIYLISDGEIDGVEQCAPASSGTAAGLTHLTNTFSWPGNSVSPISATRYANLHTGKWTPIGNSAMVPSSHDQTVDPSFAVIPSLTPQQSFSNIAYMFFKLPVPSGIQQRLGATPQTLAPLGVYRGNRCRYFDVNGNVTGYGFTTNPTWHMVEAILRYKIKRQQPQIAGLTDAEKACFNWPAIVAHATYNDTILANGSKRFMGNYFFAAEGTLAAMLETMLRCCQSYLDIIDGQIGFYNFQPLASSFTLTANHVEPGTFEISQQDLSQAPNVFVPSFRDVNIQALFAVNTANNNNGGYTEGSNSIAAGSWAMYFDANGLNPFVFQDILTYGDSSVAELNGDYFVIFTPDPTVALPKIICQTFWSEFTSPPTDEDLAGVGGYIGTQDSRFGARSPNTVQHRQHQLACGQIAPGVAALPKARSVTYDLGNTTYDQANRLMQFQRNFQLGNDVPGWTSPNRGSVKLKGLEAVDATGNAFIKMRPFQRFTIDDTVSPEFAGEYLIDGDGGGIKIIPPSKQEPLGAIVVNFRTYNPNAFSDVSDPPDDSLRTITSAPLEYMGTSLLVEEQYAWMISGDVTYNEGITPYSIAIGNLVIQKLGVAGFTNYGVIGWFGVPANTLVTLYVDDPGGGATVTSGWTAGTILPAGSPTTRFPVMTATFQ